MGCCEYVTICNQTTTAMSLNNIVWLFVLNQCKPWKLIKICLFSANNLKIQKIFTEFHFKINLLTRSDAAVPQTGGFGSLLWVFRLAGVAVGVAAAFGQHTYATRLILLHCLLRT
jgi:hypothetical protein